MQGDSETSGQSVTLFDSEEHARTMAEQIEAPGDAVTIDSVDVREVVAHAKASSQIPLPLDARHPPRHTTEGVVMAVLIRARLEEMGPSQYDESAPPLIEKLKTQPGFLLHSAFMDSGRFTVAEVWESKEQHDRWFAENVRPNLPGDVEHEVIELHNVVQP